MAVTGFDDLKDLVHSLREEAFNSSRRADLIERVLSFVADLKSEGISVGVAVCGADIGIQIFQDDQELDAVPVNPEIPDQAQSPDADRPAPEDPPQTSPDQAGSAGEDPVGVPPLQDPPLSSADGEGAKPTEPDADVPAEKELFKRFWTPEKDALLIQMKAEKRTGAFMGDQLGTTAKAVGVRLARLRAQGKVPPVNEDPRTPEAAAVDAKLWADHLKRVGNEKPWSVDLDLRLAAYMKKGMGIGGAAAMLKMDRDTVSARWTALISAPFAVNPDQVIDELREALALRMAPKVAS